MTASSRCIPAILLLVGWTTAFAQEPPDAEAAAGAGGEQALPCVPAGEDIPPGSGLEPSAAQPSAVDPVAEAGTDSGANDEEVSDAGALPEEEFTPGDEISEDYAVPLPSDI